MRNSAGNLSGIVMVIFFALVVLRSLFLVRNLFGGVIVGEERW